MPESSLAFCHFIVERRVSCRDNTVFKSAVCCSPPLVWRREGVDTADHACHCCRCWPRAECGRRRSSCSSTCSWNSRGCTRPWRHPARHVAVYRHTATPDAGRKDGGCLHVRAAEERHADGGLSDDLHPDAAAFLFSADFLTGVSLPGWAPSYPACRVWCLVVASPQQGQGCRAACTFHSSGTCSRWPFI